MQALMKRDDIQPIILGGDWSTYPMAREFYEAFGVTSICVAIDAVAVIKNSKFIDMYNVETVDEKNVRGVVEVVAAANRDKTVLLMANTDDRVQVVENVQEGLPSNVICVLPPHDLMLQVSDKVSFHEMCAQYGLDTPRTENVCLAGTDPIPPSEIPFPLVAKPAASKEYASMYPKGFQKVYFMHEQAELDKLWADLRAAGFEGTILVQELIEGDDTYMDSLTLYVNEAGKVSFCSSAHVILEDHVPALFGNPVAMITTPMPDLWESAGRMLEGIGWRGFANIDLKRDPKTGRKIFMDFNPRIGANSYYSAAAGINPMYTLVRDIVDHADEAPVKLTEQILYHRVPVKMLGKYILDPDFLAEFKGIVKAGKTFNPTRCKDDSLKSQLAGAAMEKNYIRKFNEYYPEPTQTSF